MTSTADAIFTTVKTTIIYAANYAVAVTSQVGRNAAEALDPVLCDSHAMLRYGACMYRPPAGSMVVRNKDGRLIVPKETRKHMTETSAARFQKCPVIVPFLCSDPSKATASPLRASLPRVLLASEPLRVFSRSMVAKHGVRGPRID